MSVSSSWWPTRCSQRCQPATIRTVPSSEEVRVSPAAPERSRSTVPRCSTSTAADTSAAAIAARFRCGGPACVTSIGHRLVVGLREGAEAAQRGDPAGLVQRLHRAEHRQQQAEDVVGRQPAAVHGTADQRAHQPRRRRHLGERPLAEVELVGEQAQHLVAEADPAGDREHRAEVVDPAAVVGRGEVDQHGREVGARLGGQARRACP